MQCGAIFLTTADLGEILKRKFNYYNSQILFEKLLLYSTFKLSIFTTSKFKNTKRGFETYKWCPNSCMQN